MSVRIGEVNPRATHGQVTITADVLVHASRAGVELDSESKFTLDPVQARNYAALLVRAADEVERMRVRHPDVVEVSDTKPSSESP